MRRNITNAALVASILAPGCAASVTTVGRPPSPEELYQINAQSTVEEPLHLEYTSPEHACAGGPCGVGNPALQPDELPVEIEQILSANDEALTVSLPTGEKRHPRLSLLSGVSAAEPANTGVYCGAGAAVGAGIAVGYLAFGMVGSYVLGSLGGPDPPAEEAGPSAGDVARGFLSGALAGAVVGVVVGAIAAQRAHPRRSFVFGGAPPPPAPGPYAPGDGEAGGS